MSIQDEIRTKIEDKNKFINVCYEVIYYWKKLVDDDSSEYVVKNSYSEIDHLKRIIDITNESIDRLEKLMRTADEFDQLITDLNE